MLDYNRINLLIKTKSYLDLVQKTLIYHLSGFCVELDISGGYRDRSSHVPIGKGYRFSYHPSFDRLFDTHLSAPLRPRLRRELCA
jgi:hypothetical protein